MAAWFTCLFQKKKKKYNLQLGQKIFLDVPFWQPLAAICAVYLHAAGSRQPSARLPAAARTPRAVQSVITSSIDHNEKLHASTESNRDSIYWNPCGDSVSLAYKQWVWFSECYPYVTPPPPSHALFSIPQNHWTPPPPPHNFSPFSSPLAPAAVNSRIPVCDSVHPSLFSPALTTPSLHPFLSCVLCCQAQLDQACQSSHMQSLLVLKQAVLNPCLVRPFMSIAFL